MPADIYKGLRDGALSRTAGELGLVAIDGKPYGVCVDMGIGQGVATVVVFETGDASIYFSSGGGILGGVGHEAVRNAARRVVDLSARYLEHFQRVEAPPLPAAGFVRFSLMTPAGVFTTEAPTREIEAEGSSLRPLYALTHEVITALRRTPAGQQFGSP